MNIETSFTLFERCLRCMSGLLQDMKFYPDNHPTIRKNTGLLMEQLFQYFKLKDELQFTVIENEIIYENKPRVELSESLSLFISCISGKKISRITFLKTLPERELAEFCKILLGTDRFPKHGISWNHYLKSEGIHHISCDFLSVGVQEATELEQTTGPIPEDIFQQGLEKLNELNEAMLSGKKMDYDYLFHIVNYLTPQVLNHYEELIYLGTVKAHNEYTMEHMMNVAILTALLGAALGLSRAVLDELCVAALLHDIGKTAIPTVIIDKPEKLTEEEWKVMQTHSFEGAKKIFLEGRFPEMATIVALEHHLNYDGSGYPSLYRERPLSLASRIVTITDFYDALRGTRVYCGEMPPEEVYRMMQDLKGKKFDPQLLDIFFQTIGVYPPGIEVELNTKEIAIVVKADRNDIFRPIVKIITDKAGSQVPAPFSVALTERDEKDFIRSIVRSIPPIQTADKK
ncbi:MAG: HD-GYP domain-containing protein [Candidatus Aureabacteria bacterium]|nr:HD-GYP domain-containing protein [Candidatus Auribacterota bacterium]